ncbi:MAG: hypothetical protein E7585_07665 [Ruminococcaceae bacterium]|nr:hypothetical protein [Oscillospiraceae bacterium]
MKKRVFSIFLCLALLLATVTVFASCKKANGEPVISKKVLQVDLSEYKLIQAADLTVDVRNQIAAMGDRLFALTNIAFRPDTDQEVSAVETEDLEILIGNTNRVETAKAMDSVGSFGWAIRVFDNKIVIVGSTSFLTSVALDYFNDHYLNAETMQGAVVSLNEKVTVKNLGTISLLSGSVEDAVGAYSVIYDHKLDAENGSVFGTEPNGATVDYPVTVCNSIRNDLANAVGIRPNGFALKQDDAEKTHNEVLVGNVNRPEMQEILATLGSDEYSLLIKDGKIFLAAWNDVTLERAYQLFQAMIKGSTIEDANGNPTVMIPASASMTMSIEGAWVTDFPRPEGDGIKLITTQDVSDGSHLYVYGGEGASLEAYRAYCEKLESEKYALCEGTETNLEGNYFATYVSYNAGITLRVSYFDYAYAEEQGVDNFVKGIRIVANTSDKLTLPDADYYNPKQSYRKLTETMITSLKLNYSIGEFGMSYIITLEDGSFIVYDGGGISGDGNPVSSQHEKLWNVLLDLYRKTHEGVEPDSSDPIHIRAWILTHEHQDHYKIFAQFCEKYGTDSRLRFDMLLANFASDTECYNVYNPESYVENNLENLQGKVSGGFDYIKIHTGEVYYMANAKMEVLYTHEDIWPQHLEYFNNSSSVFRITLDSTDGMFNVLESHVSIWLGDLERVGSKCMRAMYGTTLDADHVQVAHHGVNGVEAELYQLIAPEVVWFPAQSSRYTSLCNNPNHTQWYARVNYTLCHEIDSVKIIIMADKFNTSMFLTKDGAQYAQEDLFNIGDTGKPMYDSDTIIYKG